MEFKSSVLYTTQLYVRTFEILIKEQKINLVIY